MSLAPLIQDLEEEIKKQVKLCDYLGAKYENILKEKRILEEEIKAEELKKKRQIRNLGTKVRIERIPREERGKKELGLRAEQIELELLGDRLEIKRLQAEEKEKRLAAERQLEMELNLEAERLSRHDRYVASLKALLDRQNNLLKESVSLERKIKQEEQDLKLLRDNRQIKLREFLEEAPETADL